MASGAVRGGVQPQPHSAAPRTEERHIRHQRREAETEQREEERPQRRAAPGSTPAGAPGVRRGRTRRSGEGDESRLPQPPGEIEPEDSGASPAVVVEPPEPARGEEVLPTELEADEDGGEGGDWVSSKRTTPISNNPTQVKGQRQRRGASEADSRSFTSALAVLQQYSKNK